MAMFPLQSRPVPRHRSVARERVDGRDPTAGVRRRVLGVHPARENIDGHGCGDAGCFSPAPGLVFLTMSLRLAAAAGLLSSAISASASMMAADANSTEVQLAQAQPPAQPQNVETSISSLH